MGLDPLINGRLIEVSGKFEQLILELALVIKYCVQFAFLIVHTVDQVISSAVSKPNGTVPESKNYPVFSF